MTSTAPLSLGPTPAIESSLLRLRGAISRSSVDTILSRAAAVFGLVFSLQAIPTLQQAGPYLGPFSMIVVPLVTLLLLVALVVASMLKRHAQLLLGVFAFYYLIVLALWPLGVENVALMAGEQPWLWFLFDVAVACAAVAFPPRVACVYLIVLISVYIFIRTLPEGGAAPGFKPLIGAFYVLIIGAFILMIVTTLRRAADEVDLAQVTAMRQYAQAAGNQAAEIERTKVDALVHDTVLTTLITAAKATSDAERTLSAQMAERALGALQAAPDAFDADATVPLAEFTDRLADAARLLSPRIELAFERIDQRDIPGFVAEALFSATVQAMINSLQHAGDGDPEAVLRTLSVHTSSSELTVQVSDTGAGFDPAEVPTARLGLRVSIRERVQAVGGRVRIQSMPGAGTSVSVTWRPR